MSRVEASPIADAATTAPPEEPAHDRRLRPGARPPLSGRLPRAVRAGRGRARSTWSSPTRRSTSATTTTSTTTAATPTSTSTGRGRGSREVVRVLKPDGTFWLAIGDEFAAELKVHLPPRAGPVAAELGDLVLHVRGPLHEEVQPEPRPPVLLREGPEAFTFNDAGDPRPLGAAARLLRRAGQPQGPAPRRHLDPPPAGRPRRLRPPTATPGTSPASAARSRSAPAGTAARCPSSSWAGSSAPARTPATSCSTPSAAAARRWSSPRSSTAASSASSSRPTTPPQIQARLDAARVGQPLEGSDEPLAGKSARKAPRKRRQPADRPLS